MNDMFERLAMFEAKVEPDLNSGCHLWSGSQNRQGYGNFWHDGKCWKAHRFAHVVWNGPIPDGYDVMHLCDTPSCVNPAHLRAATTAENIRDMWAKGRGPNRTGQGNGRAKLTPFGVAYIREMAALDFSTATIAKKFEINPATVRRIVRGDYGGWRQA